MLNTINFLNNFYEYFAHFLRLRFAYRSVGNLTPPNIPSKLTGLTLIRHLLIINFNMNKFMILQPLL